jgi:hypothetical protein
VSLRHRQVAASQPIGDDACCSMTSADGRRRNADIGTLFSKLADQHETPRGTEFVFRGNRDELWHMVSLFVDEESICCPFYNYEQRETDDGVSLLVGTPAASVKLEL